MPPELALGIEPRTSSLPRTRSSTELCQRQPSTKIASASADRLGPPFTIRNAHNADQSTCHAPTAAFRAQRQYSTAGAPEASKGKKYKPPPHNVKSAELGFVVGFAPVVPAEEPRWGGDGAGTASIVRRLSGAGRDQVLQSAARTRYSVAVAVLLGNLAWMSVEGEDSAPFRTSAHAQALPLRPQAGGHPQHGSFRAVLWG